MLSIPLGMIVLIEGEWRTDFDDTTVAGWTRGITHGHPNRRAAVFGGLLQHRLLAEMPCDVLLDRLSDHERVRAVGVRALRSVVQSNRCLREVTGALDAAQTDDARRTLLNILISSGAHARRVSTSSVIRMTKVDDDSTRADAIFALVVLGDTSEPARSVVLRATRDRSLHVRLTAQDAQRVLWPVCARRDTICVRPDL